MRSFKCAEFPGNCATHPTANILTNLVVEIKPHSQHATTQLAVRVLTTQTQILKTWVHITNSAENFLLH